MNILSLRRLVLVAFVGLLTIFVLRYRDHCTLKNKSYKWLHDTGRMSAALDGYSEDLYFISEYSIYKEMENGNKIHYGGSIGIMNVHKFDFDLDASFIFVSEFEKTELRLATRSETGFRFLLYLIGCVSIFYFLATSILLMIEKIGQREVEIFKSFTNHELAILLGIYNRPAQFILRCARAIGLKKGEFLKDKYTPRLTELVDLWEETFSRNIKIIRENFDFDENLRVHDQPLSLVVGNVTKNSVKNTCKEFIELSIAHRKDELHFDLSNFTNGKISEKVKNAILGTNNRYGLKIVRSFLKKYFDKRDIKLTTSDEKTTISFSIPLSRIQVKSNFSEFLFTPNVAILDDNPKVLDNLKSEIESCGFNVIAFNHIDDLFFEIQKRPNYFHVIVSDRTGDSYTDREDWDSVDDDLPGFVNKMGFIGPIFLYTVIGEDSKIDGFDKILAKGFAHDWKNEIGEFLLK